MISVTHVDQFPPPEIRSVTKYQTAKGVITETSGKRKRRPSSTQAAITSRTNESRANETPSNGCWNEVPWNQPNQSQSAYTNAAHAITAAKAKTPEAIQRRLTRKPCAIAYRTTRMSSAQST